MVTTLPPRARAAVLQGRGRIAVQDVSLAEPRPGDVVVAIDFCGICGTDLHLTLEGWGEPGSVGGHEWSGTVIDSRSPDYAAGDLVVGGPLRCPPEDRCSYCTSGRPSLCRRDPLVTGRSMTSGAFADVVIWPDRALFHAPVGMPARLAALAEPLAVALHAVTRSGAAAGDRVLVTGAGPLGLMVALALRERGLTDITVSEPGERRRDKASRLGFAVTTPQELPEPSVLPNVIAEGAYDMVLECSGAGPAMATVAGLLAPAGTGVLVGSGLTPPTLDPMRVLLNELTITGSFNYDATGFEDALALLGSGRLPTDELIHPEAYGLDRLLEGIQALADGTIDAKLLINPKEGKHE